MYNTGGDEKPVASEVFKNNRYTSYKKIRKVWEIDPVEKVIPNKKKSLKVNKEKHKKSWQNWEEED